MSNDTREFAFGDDQVVDCQCPARRAGYEPSEMDDSNDIANTFDKLVRQDDDIETLRDDEHTYQARGVIPEEVAREKWMAAISRLESQGFMRSAEIGREIADELGWT